MNSTHSMEREKVAKRGWRDCSSTMARTGAKDKKRLNSKIEVQPFCYSSAIIFVTIMLTAIVLKYALFENGSATSLVDPEKVYRFQANRTIANKSG